MKLKKTVYFFTKRG